MDANETKQKVDEMGAQVFNFLACACNDDEEMNERLLELSQSFLTATLDTDADIIDVAVDLIAKMETMRVNIMLMVQDIQEGNNDNVKSEVKDGILRQHR